MKSTINAIIFGLALFQVVPVIAQDVAPAVAVPKPATPEKAPADQAKALFQQAKALLVDNAPAKDAQDGLDKLTAAADAGSIDAMVLLGDIYASGKFGTTADGAKAVASYKLAADAGNTGALVKLGALYRSGIPGVDADLTAAAGYYEQAVAKQNNAARKALAQMLLAGQGVSVDAAKAAQLLQDASEAGDPGATIALAGLYVKGTGVAADAAKAVSLLQPLADQNVKPALLALGGILRSGGAGLSADPARAYGLFSTAAGLGDPNAKKIQAAMLIKGEGVAADFSAGAAILKALADGGDAKAALQLGDLYAKGVPGTPADPKKAIAAYQQGVAADDNASRRALAGLLASGAAGKPDAATVVKLLQAAIDKQDASAAIQLGAIYAKGTLGAPNYASAVTAYDKAIALGNDVAKVKKGQALVSGPLAAAHRPEGLKILKAAADEGVAGAPVALAQALMASPRTPASVASAIAALKPAVDKGDVPSIRFLIGLYRDGVRKVLPANRPAAAKLIASSSQLLGANALAAEKSLLLSAGPFSSSMGAELSKLVAAVDRQTALQVMGKIRVINENAFVFLVQQELKKQNLFDGSLDGMLTRPTIRAIRNFCDNHGVAAICDRGPLGGPAFAAYGPALLGP